VGSIDYLHSYHSSRPRVDWNRCGQAAVATLFDYHGLDPYGLNKPIYDENDGHRHWADGEIIDRICEDFPRITCSDCSALRPASSERCFDLPGWRLTGLLRRIQVKDASKYGRRSSDQSKQACQS
jgi:hypothetical protein